MKVTGWMTNLRVGALCIMIKPKNLQQNIALITEILMKSEIYGFIMKVRINNYLGEFKNDLKKGRGKFMLSNGEYYIGDFDDDFIHGNGVFYGKNEIIRGTWETNHLIALQ